jgi:hypothetical protein
VDDTVKTNVQSKIDALKTARNGSDKTAMQTATQELNTAMSAIGEAMQKAQPAEEPKKEGEEPKEGDTK